MGLVVTRVAEGQKDWAVYGYLLRSWKAYDGICCLMSRAVLEQEVIHENVWYELGKHLYVNYYHSSACISARYFDISYEVN